MFDSLGEKSIYYRQHDLAWLCSDFFLLKISYSFVTIFEQSCIYEVVVNWVTVKFKLNARAASVLHPFPLS